jgi:hypothetical protein
VREVEVLVVALFGVSCGTVVQDVSKMLPINTSMAEIRNRFIGFWIEI